ncbi:MAG: hypothetical protein GXO92_00930 [FCB group bacterium]|nr:hypothetical protein [FCB group bacterium]
MDSLTLIGSLLFLFGLLVFSAKLIAYNRKKYQIDEPHPITPASVNQIGHKMIRLLALAIFFIALVIVYFFGR